MPEYIPQHPQTNLSIIEFYQRLGYKYKDYLPFFNQFIPNTIPTIEYNDETVPNYFLPNQPIQSLSQKTLVYVPGQGYVEQLVSKPPFNWIEQLICKPIVETINYELVTTSTTNTVYEYWDTGEIKRTITVTSYQTNPVFDITSYNFCHASSPSFPNPNGASYPYILEFSHGTSRYRTFTSDETIAELQRPILTDKLSNYYAYEMLPRYLGSKIITENTYYDRDGNITGHVIDIEEWDYITKLYARFIRGGAQRYDINLALDDRRINILMDIDAIVSS